MLHLTLYSKPECTLCDELKTLLDTLHGEIPFEVQEVNIEEELVHFERFRYLIPVLDIGNHTLLYPPHTFSTLHAALQDALKANQSDE